MSRRFPTSELRRSASSSIVARNSPRSASLHEMSVWRRLETAALIDESGVRRSWDTALRMVDRNWLSDAARAATAASSSSARLRTAAARWAAKAASTPRSSAATGPPRKTRTASSPSGSEMVPCLGLRAGGCGAGGHFDPPAAGPDRFSTAAASAPKVARRWSTSAGNGSRSPMATPAMRVSAAASAFDSGRLHPPAGGSWP